jgi:transposase
VSATPHLLPDDPGLLKAMVLAERAESERLRLIIKELQRHRFGRRAETLPADQLLLSMGTEVSAIVGFQNSRVGGFVGYR